MTVNVKLFDGLDAVAADGTDEARPVHHPELCNPRHPASWLPLVRKAISSLVRRGAND